MVILVQRDIDDPGSDSWDEDDVVLVPMAMPEIADPEDEEAAGMGFVEVTVQQVEAMLVSDGVDVPEGVVFQTLVELPVPGFVVDSSSQTEEPAAADQQLQQPHPVVQTNVESPAVEHPAPSPRKRHSSLSKKKTEKEEENAGPRQCGRRRLRRQERDHEAERLLNRLLSKHHIEVDTHFDCPFVNVSAFTKLFQNAEHMRLWLSFAHASEEEQEKFLRWGRRPETKKNRAAEELAKLNGRSVGVDPEKCRPNVAPRKAFNLITKKLRRQLVHGRIRLSELALIEQDVLLSFYARYPMNEAAPDPSTFAFLRRGRSGGCGGGDGFLDEIVAGVPSGGLEDHRLVEAAESEGRQVVVVPIGANCRPAVQSIAQYYGLTCNFLRNVAGQLYALLKNNFDDFPMPLKCLHEMAAEFKESLLVP